MEHFKTRAHLIHEPELCPTCQAIIEAMSDEPPTQVSHDGVRFEPPDEVEDPYDEGGGVGVANGPRPVVDLFQETLKTTGMCLSPLPCGCGRPHWNFVRS